MRVAMLAAAVATGSAQVATSPPRITDLRPVALHPGVNRVPAFLPGGGAATIVEAWRGNGNAHGHDAYMVLGGPSEGNAVGVVGTDDGGDAPIAETISDNPFDGERVLGSVRFATARLEGRPVSLLIRADLKSDGNRPLADHDRAVVRWYRLDHQDDALGRPTEEFILIASTATTKRYCNAELALRDVAGVPLSPGYGGPNKVDGCFPDR